MNRFDIATYGSGGIAWKDIDHSLHSGFIASDLTSALSEYFKSSEDKKLNRWRYPENPKYVVYFIAYPEALTVLNEDTGFSRDYYDLNIIDPVHPLFLKAAKAYCKTVRSKWHEAQEGEVWEVLLYGSQNIEIMTCVQETDQETLTFFNPTKRFSIENSCIQTAIRIWPEE